MNLSEAPLHIDCSEELGLLTEAATNYLRDKSTFEEMRKLAETDSGYDTDTWQELADMGWLGLAVPEEFGGSGLGISELTKICELMGRFLFSSPFLANTLATQVILQSKSENHIQDWVSDLCSGSKIATLAITEPNNDSWEPTAISCSATKNGDNYTLSGTKNLVLDGQNADTIIGSFLIDGKPALIMLDAATTSSLSQLPEKLVNHARRSTRISFDGVQVPASAVLATGDDAVKVLQHIFSLTYILLSADMAGTANGGMELTLEYARVREQFGKHIGSYQAISHPLVNAMLLIEDSLSLIYYAATVFDGTWGGESEIASRMAKSRSAEAADLIGRRAIQSHGGMGFTWECHAHLYMKRGLWGQFAYGDPTHQRRHLAALIID